MRFSFKNHTGLGGKNVKNMNQLPEHLGSDQLAMCKLIEKYY